MYLCEECLVLSNQSLKVEMQSLMVRNMIFAIFKNVYFRTVGGMAKKLFAIFNQKCDLEYVICL